MKKETIKEEIAYWENQQELDKFNYSNVSNKIPQAIGAYVALWVGVSAILFSIAEYPLDLTAFLIFSLITLTKWAKYQKQLINDMDEHILSYNARDKQIEELYSKIGVKKDKLNKRHEEIKREIFSLK